MRYSPRAIFGGVGAPLDDGGDDDRVARQSRLRRDDDAVTDAECGVGGEARVYGDGAWRILRDATRDGAWRILRDATRMDRGEVVPCAPARRGRRNSRRARSDLTVRVVNEARWAPVPRATDQARFGAATQCVVSASEPRVSSSVYDGVAYADRPRLRSQNPSASSITPVTSAPIHM